MLSIHQKTTVGKWDFPTIKQKEKEKLHSIFLSISVSRNLLHLWIQIMKSSVDFFFLDFNDSFSMNIIGEFYKRNDIVERIDFKDIPFFLNKQKRRVETKKTVIILGPGPGHPKDYKHIFPFLKEILNKKDYLFFGICLGHQILGILHRLNIKKSFSPMHGEGVEITIPKWSLFFKKEDQGRTIIVQRYNSLAVYSSQKEIMLFSTQNCFSVQFHPESVGTIDKNIFFDIPHHYFKQRRIYEREPNQVS